MIVFHNNFPCQSIIPFIIIHQNELTTLILYSIVKICLFQLTCTHIAVYHLIIHWQVRCSTKSEIAKFFYTTITNIYKWG